MDHPLIRATEALIRVRPLEMAELVRVTRVGGRYLVFEVKDVAALRRDHCICAVLIGTTPQMPTQNVFSGLPLELTAEETKLLVEKGAAYIVDDAAFHLAQLTSEDPAARQAYLQSLKTRRRAFERLADERAAESRKIGESLKAEAMAKRAASAVAKGERVTSKRGAGGSEKVADHAGDDSSLVSDHSLFSSTASPTPERSRGGPPGAILHISPTTSADILGDPRAHTVPIETPRGYPLFKHLNTNGYYVTPGIRFGADYSVYPGDPFRYHAHFMATSFEWDEEISMLDLVTGGRLGTGVKKGFLIGGEAPPPANAGQDVEEDMVRAFTIEWVAM